MSGWIKLHRSIRDHWLYEEKREFSRFEAWMDLLMAANYSDNQFLLGNELVTCKRGDIMTSKRKLSETWGWSITKVTNFLNLLEKDNMIQHESTTKNTTISILNYDTYQDIELNKIVDFGLENSENIENKNETKSNQNENKNQRKSNTKNTGESNSIETTSINGLEQLTENMIFTKVTEKKHSERNQKENEKKSKVNQKETKKNIKNIKNNNINKYIYNGVHEAEKLKDDFVEDSHKELFENENLKAIVSIYENNLGPVVGVISKDLIEISKAFQADMFEEAISIAARGGANTFNMNYIKGILRKWEDNNILNIDDLEALRNREQKAKEVSKPQKQTNYAPSKKTKFHNFQQRTDNYSEDDLERIARKKREAYYRKTQEKKQEETKEDDSNQGKVINFKFG